MKVAYINAVCGTGSTGTICEDLAEGLIKQGNQCKIYYGNGQSANPHAEKIISKWGVKWHAMIARISGLQGYNSFFETIRLSYKIKREMFDVVHIHNLHGNFINIPILFRFLKKNRIPTIITLHDCWFYTGKCTHYTECGCFKWKNNCGDCSQLTKDIPSFFFDKTKSMLNEKKRLYDSFEKLGIIAVSDWIRREAEESILKGKSIVTIYNWVDLEKFYPRHNKNSDVFTVLGVSAKWTSDMQKFKDFIQLSKMLSEDMRVILVGKMDSDIILPNNIFNIPYVQNQNELAQYYSDADVYVHLSREDSFGKVIVEAMACGTPVVVYNSTACPELVETNCGFIAEVGNLDSVYDGIYKIKELGSEKFENACVCRARNFSKESLLKQTYEFYETVINSVRLE